MHFDRAFPIFFTRSRAITTSCRTARRFRSSFNSHFPSSRGQLPRFTLEWTDSELIRDVAQGVVVVVVVVCGILDRRSCYVMSSETTRACCVRGDADEVRARSRRRRAGSARNSKTGHRGGDGAVFKDRNRERSVASGGGSNDPEEEGASC